MIKSKLLQLIQNQCNQNGIGIADDLKRVSLRQCEVQADAMYNDLLFMLLKDSKSIDYFCKSYHGVPINYNRDTKEYTVTLPAPVVQLPANIAIHLVRGTFSNNKFYPTTNEDVDLFTDLDSKYYDRTLYVLDGTTRIKLINFDYAQHNIREVQIKLIPSFVSYGWDEDVPIPSGRVSEYVGLVAKALFSNKKFLDSSSDGVTA
jgi:hypothetical protein